MPAQPRSTPFFVRMLRVTGRAMRRRCPHCGGAGIFASWFRLKEHCPTCGLTLEREEGNRVGAYMLNIAMAEAVFVVILLVVLFITWPSPPWDVLTYGSAAAVIALPILFYPFSHTLFLGIDLLVHPPEDTDRA